MNVETLPIVSRLAKRMKRRQMLQHVFAAGVLMSSGQAHLHGGHAGVLPVLEIAAGALLIGSVFFHRFFRRAAGHVAYVELAGAIMMSVEAFAKLQEPHHLPIYVFYCAQPIVLLIFTVFDAQISALRRLQATGEAFEMRVRLLRRTRLLWRDMMSWTRTADAFDITMRNGKTKRLRFKDVENREEAMDWTAAQFARRLSAAEQLPGRHGSAEERESDQVLVPAEGRSE